MMATITCHHRNRPRRPLLSYSVPPLIEPLEGRLLLSVAVWNADGELPTVDPMIATSACDADELIRVENLWPRVSWGDGKPVHLETSGLANVRKLIVAGDPNGTPVDSPSNRVDPNTTDSAFAGVGSLAVTYDPYLYLGTATAISPTHVLTAAHMIDLDNDGTIDVAPSDVEFNLNFGGDLTYVIAAGALFIHPDWTGFNNPLGVVNDDVAVIELSSPLPEGVPIYPLNTDPFESVETITLVGYGRSGDGIDGYYVNASFNVKRTGGNLTDFYDLDDEGSGAKEIFEYDFDGDGWDFGGNPGLANDIETTLGGGDSGGPSFIDDGTGGYEIFGINTYTFNLSGYPQAPLFGSGGGGMVVAEYVDFINSVIGGAGVTVSESDVSTNVAEGGATDSYTVVLNSQPDDNVQIAVNAENQVSVVPLFLTFTPDDWDQPQTVTVTAVDDNDQEGFHTGIISHVASSNDPEYDGIAIASVTANITDNDVPPALLYFSLGADGSMGGLSVTNEDIIGFNGTQFSLYFDGSDVGLSGPLGGFTIDAFAIISDTEILMSFAEAGVIPAPYGAGGDLWLDDSDIVKFTASSLGPTTSGTFTMYFDGSDVDLSRNSEDVDAIELLSNGHLLISTSRSVSVTGVAAEGEDIIEFAPSSLGENTAGTWTLYFDGSDVGLADPGENIDALAMDSQGNIYLSTQGDLSVNGVTAADEDVVVFVPSSLGADTSGTFDPALFFDGSDYGLDGNNICAFDIPPVNELPVADDDFYSVDEDNTLSVPGPGVLANDTDAEGKPLTAVLIADVSHGLLMLNGDGSFDYTPAADFFGGDSFTYKANDGKADSNTATVSLTIASVNDDPNASNDIFAVYEDIGANTLNVLVNDTYLPDPPEVLTIIDKTDGAFGAVAITGGGAELTYTPSGTHYGPDSFTYTIDDGNGGTDSAEVLVNVGTFPGDLNYDRGLDNQDIDILAAAIRAGSDEPQYDLNGDSFVNFDDHSYMVTTGIGTGLGDANLDYAVDVSDLNLWKASRFEAGTGWASGDFNGDGVTDVEDLNIWKANRFTSFRSVVDLPA